MSLKELRQVFAYDQLVVCLFFVTGKFRPVFSSVCIIVVVLVVAAAAV